jgi:hypothetical protein
MQFLHWIKQSIGSTSLGNQPEEFFMHLARFPKVFLAHLSTPLEPMERLSKELGVEIWIKRDDCTGMSTGGNTGLRLPATRQAHSPSQYTGSYGYCSNFAKISPPNICARPRPFVLKWRYAEVPWLENRPYVQELTSENLAQA